MKNHEGNRNSFLKVIFHDKKLLKCSSMNKEPNALGFGHFGYLCPNDMTSDKESFEFLDASDFHNNLCHGNYGKLFQK